MVRRTKIVATLGPAINTEDILQQLIAAGVNVVRINMSHGTAAERVHWIEQTRAIARRLNTEVGILVDLQGPKIRVSRFKSGKVQLVTGQQFILDADLANDQGTEQAVGIDYKTLPTDVHSGDILLLDDGRVVLEVKKIEGKKIHCQVNLGGVLSNNKGINRQGGGLSAQALTQKDQQDIVFAAQHEVDYVALSFPRSAADVVHCRELLVSAGSKAGVIAKIERVEAVDALDEIIKVSDAVMVARGDLGVEIGFAELPAIQKRIISRARALDRAVITATQMMESMIDSPIPTRAEVSDVANAVLDGTDAVMLSAETASGHYPVQAVESMAEICLVAERQKDNQVSLPISAEQFERVDQALAMAAMYAANNLGVKAIIALTESGATTLWMSRVNSDIPIYGISRNPMARGRMTLYRGVYPIELDITNYKRWEIIRVVLTMLRDQGIVQAGERIVVTRGDATGIEGFTNTLKVVTVEAPPPNLPQSRDLGEGASS